MFLVNSFCLNNRFCKTTVTVAKDLYIFSKELQLQQPMLPFMAEELYTILWTIWPFVNKFVLNAATTSAKLSKINFLKKEIILSSKVDNGFVHKIILQETEGLRIMQ